MKMLKLICENCKIVFERSQEYYNRNVKQGFSLTCSRHCGAVISNKKYPRKYGIENLGKFAQKDKFSPFRYILINQKSRAKRNKITFTIQLIDLVEQWEKQNGICNYTNYKMILPAESTTIINKTKTPYIASLDRIDSSCGYEKGNIEFVCLAVNYAKNNFSKEEMIKFFNDLHYYHISK